MVSRWRPATAQVTCIFGPNGCGKSTLLGAIAGIVDVWGGEVDLDGTSLDRQAGA